MINVSEFTQKENMQSHSFIFFNNGPAYFELGWKEYKKFNKLISDILIGFKEKYGVEVYLHEHENIDVERAFLWCFSFIEPNLESRNILTKKLVGEIGDVMSVFPQIKNKEIINNHDEVFSVSPEWGEYYCSLVDGADYEVEPTYPPKEKSYQKEDINLDPLKSYILISDFKEIIGKAVSIGSTEDLLHKTALDGFFSTRYRANKYLREELVPAKYFVIDRKISDSARIKFGIERDNFDVKIKESEDSHEMILEITLACPENDHKLFSLMGQVNHGLFPMKTMSHLKKEIDSLPRKIVEAINKKHDKNYQDNRILMVVIQPEYVYQGEEYLINEIIDEVRETTSKGKGNFAEVLLLCSNKFYSIFS